MSDKYPGHNIDDTFWDEHHRKNGQMTNREFFTSNGKGGFYEGWEWNGKEWVPNAETREREEVAAEKQRKEFIYTITETKKARHWSEDDRCDD